MAYALRTSDTPPGNRLELMGFFDRTLHMMPECAEEIALECCAAGADCLAAAMQTFQVMPC